ncbi:hypothetical protein IR012_10590 [Pseudomonas putida]|uniref:hypothetical protein n=1 Tax=Pseudomonas TaxID=286 RepID=UPI0007C6D12F|nr:MULTISPECIES: hypothetical protein [Pseudomonas]MBF8669663.1 hypothetical protein [Pseudomonas putida]MBF8712757.1 hypothetical protein [Pseudomonas putida]
MDNTDFDYDVDLFQKQLGVTKFAVKGAAEKLLGMVEHWSEVGSHHWGRSLVVSADPVNGCINGEIVGKKFVIRYEPLGYEGNGVIEAVVVINDLVSGEPMEVSRFLMKSDGSILSAAGDVLMAREHPEWSYRTLVAIVRRVLNARSVS